MLFHLLAPLGTHISVLNVTRYITFRTAAASLSALAISLALGPWMVRKLREFQIGQVIRAEGPTTHKPKAGTPTMGGLLILTAALIPTLLWSNLTNVYVWIAALQNGLSAAPRPCRRGNAARARSEQSLQHAVDFSVFQAADSRSRLGLSALRSVRARGSV